MNFTKTCTRLIQAWRDGRLISAIKSRLLPFLTGLKYLFNNPAAGLVRLHCPEYSEPSKSRSELVIVDRIFRSFKKMKEDQKKVSNLYLPSSMWQQQLDDSYANFTESIRSDKVDPFHFFLNNFGTWKTYHGVESNVLIRDNMRSVVTRRYLENVYFHQELQRWQLISQNKKPLSSLNYPVHGSQVGAYIDGIFMGIGSFNSEINGSMLRGLIDDIGRPVVAELGAGYGKLAYFTLRELVNFCFVDFDLPETLCLAAYYLMMAWPDKKVLLYGEEEYSSMSHGCYDLIFMPSYEISKVGNGTVDLFMNKNSLGEMNPEAASNYVRYITDSARYFFHMNHDLFPNIFEDGSRGLLGSEYPVPKDIFKLLFRYRDAGHMNDLKTMDPSSDIFMYLYERRGKSIV